MTPPLVSIIIPTYNRAHLIGETLDSVLAQTYAHWECIVVDDGSTDDTDTVLKNYCNKDTRFKYVSRPDNHKSGGNGARNYGFRLSKGAYVVFLDSDDLLTCTALSERVHNAQYYKCDILINNSVAFQNTPGDLDIVWNIVDDQDSRISLINRFLNTDMPWSTNSVTWKSDFFKNYGGWNELLVAWQDWELHCRVLFHKPILKYISNTYDNYFRHSPHQRIGSSYKSMGYILSLETAVKSIEKLISQNKEIRNDNTIINSFRILIFRFLIKYPVKRGYVIYALKNFLDTNIFKYLSRLEFMKAFILEFLGKSSKIKKYAIFKIYTKHKKKLSYRSMHLKYKVSDLK